jgi:hypothetical protein
MPIEKLGIGGWMTSNPFSILYFLPFTFSKYPAN